ncbi:peptidyl-prolyl cis-trans isomerase B (cyclophilin B) [Kribbella amoyensis]|uniref:Peptidyl-prolyl cis-trans isomerase B (Cyclophilin B) n=1 Tax=Kribbella amoyensis TaxID=996641 RepID=A0A561BWF6_9ACTN|nr:peptidylprolyl isomerase [Kribbella amoyensis]TWD83158.1 peptidyl-prolyl cis-trans isomerase B (cyclophilin B) [Kribbella amoyensis]
MRRWKRVLAIVVVAALAFALEGWIASAQAASPMFHTCTYTRTAATGAERPPYSLAPTLGLVKVVVDTSAGPIELELDRRQAPCAVHSLDHLALRGFYDGTSCDRLTATLLECAPADAGYTFRAEASGRETYPRGTVALSGTGSHGSRFFVVHQQVDLPARYTVVGRVVAGIGVLDNVVAGGIGADGRPRTPVTITDVRVG